jgi:hypothetical protein
VKAIYQKLAAEKHPFLGMDEKLADELRKGTGLPEGPGWLVELQGFNYFWDTPQFLELTLVDEIKKRGAALDQAAGANPQQPGQAPADASKPAEAAKPAAPSADTDAAPDKEKPPVRDIAKEKDEYWNKVIRGHVSHPFIFLFKPVDNPEPGKFDILGGSVLDSLVGGGGGGGGGAGLGAGRLGGMAGGADMGAAMKTMMGGKGGGGGGGASGGTFGNGDYSPLVPIGSGSGGGGGSVNVAPGGGRGGAMGGMGDMIDRMRKFAGTGRGAAMPGVGLGNTGLTTKPVPKKASPTRTEFRVIFVWKEWTPSDSLIPGKETAPTEGAK